MNWEEYQKGSSLENPSNLEQIALRYSWTKILRNIPFMYSIRIGYKSSKKQRVSLKILKRHPIVCKLQLMLILIMVLTLQSNLLTALDKLLTSWVQPSIHHLLIWAILIQIVCLLPTQTPASLRCNHPSTSRWLVIILHQDYLQAKNSLQDWVCSRVGRHRQWFVTTTVMTTEVHQTTHHWLIQMTTQRKRKRILMKNRDYYDIFYHYSNIYSMKNQSRNAFLRKRMSLFA